MTVVFVFSVAVQYNDPDPIRWMTIYGLAALCCIWSFLGRLAWYFPAAVGVVALLWASLLAPSVIGQTSFSEMFGSIGMINLAVEEAREMMGLLIVAFWMAVLAVTWYRSGQ